MVSGAGGPHPLGPAEPTVKMRHLCAFLQELPFSGVDALACLIHICITMSSATVRDLRNRFPQVRKLVESSGEVVLTERGIPRYRLALYVPPRVATPQPVDYWSRLCSYQPRPLTKAQSAALRSANRGER